MSNGRQYGGWDKMVEVLGPIHERYQRKAGQRETVAGFTADGRQVTEHDWMPIEKATLLPWAKTELEEATGIKWVKNEDGSESVVTK
jgi:hypothetical protein